MKNRLCGLDWVLWGGRAFGRGAKKGLPSPSRKKAQKQGQKRCRRGRPTAHCVRPERLWCNYTPTLLALRQVSRGGRQAVEEDGPANGHVTAAARYIGAIGRHLQSRRIFERAAAKQQTRRPLLRAGEGAGGNWQVHNQRGEDGRFRLRASSHHVPASSRTMTCSLRAIPSRTDNPTLLRSPAGR